MSLVANVRTRERTERGATRTGGKVTTRVRYGAQRAGVLSAPLELNETVLCILHGLVVGWSTQGSVKMVVNGRHVLLDKSLHDSVLMMCTIKVDAFDLAV